MINFLRIQYRLGRIDLAYLENLVSLGRITSEQLDSIITN